MTKVALILWFLISIADCSACQIGWKSENELKAQAELVVSAKLITVVSVVQSLRSDIYTYQFEIKSLLKGRYLGKMIEVTYADLKAHLVGKTRICPADKNGSGIENDLKLSKSYTLYLLSERDPELLLAMPTGDN